MIFAALEYEEPYESIHDRLVTFVESRFAIVESGIQTDSWIWVHIGSQKVAIDTFTGMKHFIKSDKAGAHVDAVIEALKNTFSVNVYPEPEIEAHEDVG